MLAQWKKCGPPGKSFMIYEKRLLLRCVQRFEPNWINNMDHMRISGTDPSLVILYQFKSWKVMSQKGLNKLKPKGMV